MHIAKESKYLGSHPYTLSQTLRLKQRNPLTFQLSMHDIGELGAWRGRELYGVTFPKNVTTHKKGVPCQLSMSSPIMEIFPKKCQIKINVINKTKTKKHKKKIWLNVKCTNHLNIFSYIFNVQELLSSFFLKI